MADPKSKFYRFADLSDYSFRERIRIRLIDLVCYFAMQLIGKTIRFEVEGWHNYESVLASGKLPVWPFWHNRIFLSTIYFRDRGILVITSKSRDGEYIARFIQRFGFGAIRGSSSRGGARALIEMRNAMRLGLEAAFTVDGPRGPRYEAKPGPVYLAKLSDNPVLPFLVEAQKYWTLNTWDKLQIPKPFTKARLIIAEPFYVCPESDEKVLDMKVAEMQRSLDELVDMGKKWREGAD
ncbi:MAG: lysophospholipid acyltransferase family protein [Pyrinomonadaceae bacterium]